VLAINSLWECYQLMTSGWHCLKNSLLAQSFIPNLARDGRQTCRPSQRSRVTGLCYFLLAFWSHWNSQLGTSLSPISCRIMVCLHEQCFSECWMRQPHPKIGIILFLCGVGCGCCIRHSEKHCSCKQTFRTKRLG
jgi:hypothetical protein